MPPLVIAEPPPQTPVPARFPMGRLLAEDDRDADYPIRALLARSPAPVRRRSFRLHLPAPKAQWRDQGARSSCTEHAMANRLVGHPWPRGLASLPWKQHALYERAQCLDEWAGGETPAARADGGPYYEGTSSRAICRAAREAGLIESWWNVTTVDGALDYVLHDTNDPLLTGGLLVGTDWDVSMFDLVGGYAVPDGRSVGGHEWYIHGANLKTETFFAENSWVSMRLFRIRFEHVRQLLERRRGDATAVVETPRAPKSLVA